MSLRREMKLSINRQEEALRRISKIFDVLDHRKAIVNDLIPKFAKIHEELKFKKYGKHPLRKVWFPADVENFYHKLLKEAKK